jgi:hypothetical protein
VAVPGFVCRRRRRRRHAAATSALAKAASNGRDAMAAKNIWSAVLSKKFSSKRLVRHHQLLHLCLDEV